jgi:hypothetical protein
MKRMFSAFTSTLLSLALFCASTEYAGAGVQAPAVYIASVTPGTVTWHNNEATELHVRVTVNGASLPPQTPIRASLQGDATFSTGLKTSTAQTDVNGDVTYALLPGRSAHTLVFRLDVRDGYATATVDQRAVSRPPTVVGYATTGIGAIPGNIEAPDAAPNGTDTREGAISIYGTGQISKNTTGSFAYDSTDSLEETLGSGPFLDNPDDRPFPIYGDTSLRYDDALSTDRMYARIDNGYTTGEWGEFYATSGLSVPAGGYSVLVNGAMLHGGGNDLRGGAFTATNHFEFGRQLFSPTGLGIADSTLHPDIVVGSDTITLVQLDAHTGAVLNETVLTRGSDYSLDYASGLLHFITIILPYDDQFNPQLVVAQYEFGGTGADTTLTGANGAWNVTHDSLFQTWYLNDATGAGNLDLLGQSFSLKTPGVTLAVSHERSNGLLPNLDEETVFGDGGDAYGATLSAHGSRASYGLNYQDTAAGYENPYGTYDTSGLRSLHATASWQISKISSIDASATSATNALPAVGTEAAVDNSDDEESLAMTVKPSKRLSYHVGVDDVSGAGNGTLPQTLLPNTPTLGAQGSFLVPPMFGLDDYEAGEGHALQGDAGANWQFAPRANFSLDRTNDLSSSVDPYDPAQTDARLSLDVGNSGQAFINQMWQDQNSLPLAASDADALYDASARSATSFGFDQKVGDASLESGYAVEHTDSGSDLFDAIGVRTALATSQAFSADAFLQVGQELFPQSEEDETGPDSPFFVVGGTSVNYQHSTFKATGTFEVRTGYAGGTSMQLGAAGPISPAVSLYGAYTGDFTDLVRDSEVRAGLAYRPSLNDRYVTLLSVDSFDSNLTDYDAYITNVAQLQELYRSSTRTEWAASVGYKITGDAFFAPHTLIYGLRGDQRIGPRLDIGAEYHFSDLAPISGTSATGFAAELGYRIGATLRVAGGYNFSGFADPATAVNPTHRGLYATLSTYVDRIFGWGEDH